MRIGLLNNLKAGRNERQVQRLLESCDHHPEVVHLETTCGAAVPEALWELANQDVDILAVNGGDGTLQFVLTEILGHDAFDGRVPMIAPLRGGRTNMTALDIGTQRDSAQAMSDLISAVRAGEIEDRIVERNVLRVEYGLQHDLGYGMFFGGGVIARAVELVQRAFPKGRAQGVFGGTLVTAGLLGRLATGQGTGDVLEPDKVEVLLDREPVDADQFTILMGCTLDRLFSGMNPFWGRGEGPVRFTGFEKNAEQLWKAIPGILKGQPAEWVGESSGYISRNVRQVAMRLDSAFTIDGEVFENRSDGGMHISAEDVVRFVRA